jgi:hypothetical protein
MGCRTQEAEKENSNKGFPGSTTLNKIPAISAVRSNIHITSCFIKWTRAKVDECLIQKKESEECYPMNFASI